MNTFSCIRKNHILIENLLNLTLLDATWNCLKLSQAVQVVQDNGAGLKSQLMKNCSSDVKHIKCLQAGVRYQVYLSKVPSSNNTMSCQVTVPSKIKLLYQVYLSRVPSSNNTNCQVTVGVAITLESPWSLLAWSHIYLLVPLLFLLFIVYWLLCMHSPTVFYCSCISHSTEMLTLQVQVWGMILTFTMYITCFTYQNSCSLL